VRPHPLPIPCTPPLRHPATVAAALDNNSKQSWTAEARG
jgi:hypothetical protein